MMLQLAVTFFVVIQYFSCTQTTSISTIAAPSCAVAGYCGDYSQVVDFELTEEQSRFADAASPLLLSTYDKASYTIIDTPLTTNASQHVHPWLATCVSLSFLFFIIFMIIMYGG